MRLLQKHARNLTDRKRERLAAYLGRHPAIAQIYAFKEELIALLVAKSQTKEQCRILVHRLIEAIAKLKATPFEDGQTLARSLEAGRSRSAACGGSHDRMASQRAFTAR